MKRFYSYFIPIIIVLIVLLGLYYPQLNIIVQQALTIPNVIKIFLYSNNTLITNGSVSVFVFYPTSNGTVFQEIYNASNDQYYQFSVESLINWAKHWIEFDIKHKTIIYPSILIFASYSIINQTTITVLTQTYATPLNISQIIKGLGGKNIIINFTTPIIHHIKIQQTTTSGTQRSSITIEYYPNVIGWYPNNESVGPIAIATIVGPPNAKYYTATLITLFYTQQDYSMNIGFYISQPSLGKLPVMVTVPGPSLTVCDTNSIIKEYNGTEIGTPSPYDIGQLYVLGQVAWVNWTEIYFIPHDTYQVFHFLQVILTEIAAVENGNAAAPEIYDYRSYLPNTSYNELHKNSYSLIKQYSHGFIAPVYFNNLTYMGSATYYHHFGYANVYIHGVNAEFQAGLNVGALAAIAIPEASPELLTTLGMVNIGVIISSRQETVSVVELDVTTSLATPLNVYYANYSALYDINGKYYVIPSNVFYLNYTN